jgi:hypothetical protein
MLRELLERESPKMRVRQKQPRSRYAIPIPPAASNWLLKKRLSQVVAQSCVDSWCPSSLSRVWTVSVPVRSWLEELLSMRSHSEKIFEAALTPPALPNLLSCYHLGKMYPAIEKLNLIPIRDKCIFRSVG